MIVLAWCVDLTAVPVRAETLFEAMANAYMTNPNLRAERKELSRTDDQLAESLAFWRPQATVQAGGGYIEDFTGGNSQKTTTSQFSSQQGPTTLLNLQVKQPLYNWTNGPRIRQSEQYVQSQRAHLVGVEQDVLLRAASAYLDLVRAEASLRYSVDYEGSLRKSLASTKRQFEMGLVRNSSVAQADSRLAAATAQRIQSEGTLATARGNYVLIIGNAPDAVSMPEMPHGVPASVDEVIDASSSNPNLIAARYQETAAQEGVDLTFGQKLPEFSAQSQVNPNSATILGVMTVPLYNGLLDPQLRASKDLVAERRLQTEIWQRQARQTALSAWHDYQAAQGRAASYESQLKSSRIAVEGTGREYNLGLRPVSDLLNNQLEYFRAQVDLLGAQRDLRVAALQVLAAMGRLTARDLGLNVAPYEVEKHYDRVRDEWWGTGSDLEQAR
jgi:TolC family type I secretion outer membrane protein